MKNWVIPILKFVIVTCILYYLISHDRMDIGMLYRLWTSPFALVMALIFILWIFPLGALRLWLLLKIFDIRIPFFSMYLLNWIGGFFSASLPGSVSGDVVKGFYISQTTEKKNNITNIIVTLVVDRIIGLSSLIILAFLSFLLCINPSAGETLPNLLTYTVTGLFIGILIFYGILIIPFQHGKDPLTRFFLILPGKDTLLNIYGAFRHFQHHKRVLLYTIMISISIHISLAVLFLNIAQFMGKSVAFTDQLLIMPLGLITTAIPLAPGGIGIGHVAFDNLYRMIGISGGVDIFNMLVTVQLTVLLLGGIPYLLMRKQSGSKA